MTEQKDVCCLRCIGMEVIHSDPPYMPMAVCRLCMGLHRQGGMHCR